MSLRNQPYFPLYVQDYLTDEKLNSCSASTQGVYIKILCILHKSETYGKLLFKQKDKQKKSNIENFALKLCKLLPFDYDTILPALDELVEEGVIDIDDSELTQKRMYQDGIISIKRSQAGKKGGGNPNLFKQKDKQNDKQNPEYEYTNEYEDESSNNKVSKVFKKPELFEVEDYLLENYLEPKETASHFYDHYESNGWKVGKNSMKDWKGAVRNWMRNKKKFNNGTKDEPKIGRIPVADIARFIKG